MNRDVFLTGLLCSVFVFGLCWWLFNSNPDLIMQDGNTPITIVLRDGRFEPSAIKVPEGKSITLHVVREDTDHAASFISFPQLNYRYHLPMHQRVQIILPPLKHGDVIFQSEWEQPIGHIFVS